MPTFTVYKGSENGKPVKATFTNDQLSADKVQVRVTASGLCGTDLHQRHRDMVLGHEGVGVVEATGPEVKSLKAGDRVGWGFQHNACGRCKECIGGNDIYCAQREIYGSANLDQGSFSTRAIWREAFLHKIPDGITDEDAAPLQCAGATVFSALQHVQPGETVAVMGVGGLGHLAIQFAAQLGCRVVVISGSSGKKKQALELGAHQFLAMKDGDTLQDGVLIDRLLVTTAAQPDWARLLPMMAMKSTIFPLSVSEDDLEIPYMPLILQGIRIQGVLVATRGVHRSMLEFAALHNIKPIIEKYPMTEEGISTAMSKLEEGSVKYRAVLIPEA